MSKISDALNAERRIPASSLERWMLTLDKDDQAALEAAAVDTEFSNAALLRVIEAAGYGANKDTIAKWRAQRGFRR